MEAMGRGVDVQIDLRTLPISVFRSTVWRIPARAANTDAHSYPFAVT